MTIKKKTTTLRKEAKPRDQHTRAESAPPEITTQLATFNGFRVNRNIDSDPSTPSDYLSALRQVRALNFCAGISLLGAFFIFAFVRPYGLPISLLALGLAALIELAGGLRLLKSRHDRHKANVLRQAGSIRTSSEQIADDQDQLHQDRLTPLYSKSTREGSAHRRKEAGDQRIDKLVDKSKQMLSGADRLEKHEFYSEEILSFDRAARSALTAILLSRGVETKGKVIEGGLPQLKRILRSMKFEDVAYLGALRDRINKGYDATKAEAQRAREVAEPLIADALEYLGASLMKGKERDGSPSPTQMEDYSMRSASSARHNFYQKRAHSSDFREICS